MNQNTMLNTQLSDDKLKFLKVKKLEWSLKHTKVEKQSLHNALKTKIYPAIGRNNVKQCTEKIQ